MARQEVIKWVARLIDYGGGGRDPDIETMTLGEVADVIIAAAEKESSDE